MRRFERLADEKKRGKNERKVDFVVNEMEETPQVSKTEIKERSESTLNSD